MRNIIVILFIFLQSWAFGQSVLGQWRTFPSFLEPQGLTSYPGGVYAASETAIFQYSLEDNSYYILDKSNHLSDINPTAILHHDSLDILVVGYENGNVDLISPNSSINLSDVKRTGTVTGSKRINNIYFRDHLAYLSCGFGIVVLDLSSTEIVDTYRIGDQGVAINVADIAIYKDSIYAASDQGLKVADMSNPFLANFQNWSLVDSAAPGRYDVVEVFDTVLYAAQDSDDPENFGQDILQVYDGVNWAQILTPRSVEVYDLKIYNDVLYLITHFNIFSFTANDFFVHEQRLDTPEEYLPWFLTEDTEGNLWVGAHESGFISNKTGSFQPHFPKGPGSAQSYSVSAYDGEIWVSSGSVDVTFTNNFNRNGVSGYVNGTWLPYNYDVTPEFKNRDVYDILQILIDPENPTKTYGASFFGGLIEFSNGELVNIYQSDNSIIQDRVVFGGSFAVPSVGVDYDGNLWIANSNTETPFIVRTPTDEWIGVPLNNINPEDILIHRMINATNNFVYGVRPKKGVIVFDHNGTIGDFSDDRHRTLTANVNEGGLPSTNIYCITEDLDGEIWIGTDKGPAIYFNPTGIFESEEVNAQQILIEQDGNVQIVLETEVIQDIEIDGGNRKWIATANSGAFLLSPDGSEIIANFTAENSTLHSNNVLDIAVDHKTGEVLFATPDGLSGFTGNATESLPEEDSEMTIIPNPVFSSFEGNIAIRGLYMNSEVTITDIAGNQIIQLESEGGTAVWDGRNLEGKKVLPGIYLIYSSTTDGTETRKGKIVIDR